jgi:hypothetical protein
MVNVSEWTRAEWFTFAAARKILITVLTVALL